MSVHREKYIVGDQVFYDVSHRHEDRRYVPGVVTDTKPPIHNIVTRVVFKAFGLTAAEVTISEVSPERAGERVIVVNDRYNRNDIIPREHMVFASSE